MVVVIATYAPILGFRPQRRCSIAIHARHCWRANPLTAPGGGAKARRFNPRPPLLAGESLNAWRGVCQRQVSIHARHCWRANPTKRRGEAELNLFQSTPAIAGGRIHANNRTKTVHCDVSIHARHCWRANPSMGHTMTPLIRVSIHARHCWRANPCTGAAPAPLCNCFNPRPPLLAGESAMRSPIAL